MATLRMLSSMRHLRLGRMWSGTLLGLWASGLLTAAGAQSCVTQSRMTVQQRTEVGSAAYALASAVQAGDAARVRESTVAQYAADFNRTSALVETTASQLAGDALQVTQAYLLDATGRSTSDTAEADFACPLANGTSETDFSIPGLPPGRFAFVMVEARGVRPWLLSFLLQQQGAAWKMAGFYPHERTAAGHDGLWYWTTARADARADKPWLAWLLYGEADALLRPAPFAGTGNLDKLRTEQRTAAPQALSNGLNPQAPLTLQGANGAQFAVTRMEAQSGNAGRSLNLVLYLQPQAGASRDAAATRDAAAATALLTAHPELRAGFDEIAVVTEEPSTLR